MANYTSTIEYKFKVTNNLNKDDAITKKFNFYIGLPYSKRKYRYMQIVNLATNKEGQHLFNIVLGHSERCVAAMTKDILRNTHASLEPAVTKVMRITYASVNVGQTSILYNDANKKTLDTGDWTGISGEYMKVKSFRTNGNDEVLGLIFDAADRSVVSARKNDNTNVVAKPDIVKVPQPDTPVIDIDGTKLDPILISSTNRKVIKDYIADLSKANQELKQKVKGLTEENDYLKKDIEAREKDIERLATENADLYNQLKGAESKPDETQKTFRGKFIDRVVDMYREHLETLSDDELIMNMKGKKL